MPSSQYYANVARRDAFYAACAPLDTKMQQLHDGWIEKAQELNAVIAKANKAYDDWHRVASKEFAANEQRIKADIAAIRIQFYPEEAPGYVGF
jgi:hypothetical protein